jgi:hypothetical protein
MMASWVNSAHRHLVCWKGNLKDHQLVAKERWGWGHSMRECLQGSINNFWQWRPWHS